MSDSEYNLFRKMGLYKIGFVNQKLSGFRLHSDQKTLKNTESGYSELIKFYQKLYTHPDYSFLSDDLKNIVGRIYLAYPSFVTFRIKK